MSKAKPLAATLAFAAAALAGAPAAQAQDAAQGQRKAAMCTGCHGIVGYQASFPQVHKVPMIAGQNAKYIAAALTEYKKGDRKHPTMRAIAGSLSDTDMADLAAYYEKLGASSIKPVADAPAPPPDAAVAALVARGACVSCHGANFSKPIDPSYPKLAGQHADYLTVALLSYATSNHALVGRGNVIMQAQVKAFRADELKQIARYIGSLPGELRTVPESEVK